MELIVIQLLLAFDISLWNQKNNNNMLNWIWYKLNVIFLTQLLQILIMKSFYSSQIRLTKFFALPQFSFYSGGRLTISFSQNPKLWFPLTNGVRTAPHGLTKKVKFNFLQQLIKIRRTHIHPNTSKYEVNPNHALFSFSVFPWKLEKRNLRQSQMKMSNAPMGKVCDVIASQKWSRWKKKKDERRMERTNERTKAA